MNLYFDNACTSFPKPKEVGEYVLKHINEGGSYGRAGYPRIFKSSKVVEELRSSLAQMLSIKQTENIVFTQNSTSAINMIVNGLDYKYGKILISPLEHNAVLRPLENLRKTKGIRYEVLPHCTDGIIDINSLKHIDFKSVDLIVVNHVSNVNGIIQPLLEIKEIAGNTPFMIDASQSIGKIDINNNLLDLDYIAFTGHKGLLGPTGTGGFYVKNPDLLNLTYYGGTGSNSDSYDMPLFMPDRFQPGTPNVSGLYGLFGAIKHRPVKKWSDTRLFYLIESIKCIKNLRVIASNSSFTQSDVFSVVPLKRKVSELSALLFKDFGIETRSGLHCSPLAHKTLGTFPEGTVRFSLSPFHTDEDLDYLLMSIRKINE